MGTQLKAGKVSELADGAMTSTLEGTVVTCPLHGSQFDLKDGKVVRWLRGTGVLARVGRALKSPKKLTTYRVQVENGQLLIEI